MLSRQANTCPPPRVLQLEPSRHQPLKNATRVIFPRSSLDFLQSGNSIATQRILILKRIINILKILQCPRSMQVGRQIRHDSVGQATDLRVKLRAIPRHVEQEYDIVVLVAVKAQHVPASFQAVLSEESRQRLEFDGGVLEEGVLFVEIQLVVYNSCDILQYGEVV